MRGLNVEIWNPRFNMQNHYDSIQYPRNHENRGNISSEENATIEWINWSKLTVVSNADLITRPQVPRVSSTFHAGIVENIKIRIKRVYARLKRNASGKLIYSDGIISQTRVVPIVCPSYNIALINGGVRVCVNDSARASRFPKEGNNATGIKRLFTGERDRFRDRFRAESCRIAAWTREFPMIHEKRISIFGSTKEKGVDSHRTRAFVIRM